jgi:hypothetical protein
MMNRHVVWQDATRELNLELKNGALLDIWEIMTLDCPPRPTGKYVFVVLNGMHCDFIQKRAPFEEVLDTLKTWLGFHRFGAEESAATINQIRGYFEGGKPDERE